MRIDRVAGCALALGLTACVSSKGLHPDGKPIDATALRGERTLAAVEVRLAASDARNHAAEASGRPLTDRSTAEGSRGKVRERLAQLEQERAELLEKYRRDARIVDAAPAEASARAAQSAAVGGQEDQARLARARGAAPQQDPQRGPSLSR